MPWRTPTALLKLLACPTCKGALRQQKQFLTCSRCAKAYPILDSPPGDSTRPLRGGSSGRRGGSGVPDLLPADAWPLEKAQKARFAHALRLVPAAQSKRARASSE
ncbi:MAG TPA: Trm112 family protein [archaeon]|nr:Trm112 family protein [archaeon]